jgi:glycosyltransferase involved in cell wall biosynthesis
MDIRVSVVMASFNGERFIREQIDSWLSILADNDEVVVSDDGSYDKTRHIIESINDIRLRLLPHGPRLGYQKNFERAIFAARGRFIFFSDQDDICLPDRIRLSVEGLAKYACVVGDAFVVNEQLQEVHESFFRLRKAGKFSALGLFIRPSAIGATMACSREFVVSAMPFPSSVPHDQWLSILAAIKGQLFVSTQPFILYRRHPGAVSCSGNVSSRNYIKRIKERVLLAKSLVCRKIIGW